ncbi:MAG TPA: hypothetical protein VJ898_03315 [Natrialbaceae archaeon]|nr:hypothetical protein [Natrialbaceae archaeon]
MTTTTANRTTVRRTPATRTGRGFTLESVILALAFAVSMGLALLLSGVVTATLAVQLPAGPVGMALTLALTLGALGFTITITRRAFLAALDLA